MRRISALCGDLIEARLLEIKTMHFNKTPSSVAIKALLSLYEFA